MSEFFEANDVKGRSRSNRMIQSICVLHYKSVRPTFTGWKLDQNFQVKQEDYPQSVWWCPCRKDRFTLWTRCNQKEEYVLTVWSPWNPKVLHPFVVLNRDANPISRHRRIQTNTHFVVMKGTSLTLLFCLMIILMFLFCPQLHKKSRSWVEANAWFKVCSLS